MSTALPASKHAQPIASLQRNGAEQEMERRRYDTEEQREAMMPELRDVSRQMYLQKREAQKLVELEQELRDEELLFAVSSMSMSTGLTS